MAEYQPSFGGQVIGQAAKTIYEGLGGGQPPQPNAQPAPSLDLMLEAEKRGLLPPDKTEAGTDGNCFYQLKQPEYPYRITFLPDLSLQILHQL